jgi:predicted dinucleotide-binding enzyme
MDAKGMARAGTPRDAAQEADAVLLAVHCLRIEDIAEEPRKLCGASCGSLRHRAMGI